MANGLFHRTLSQQTVSVLLLRRDGLERAVERDEAAIARWRRYTWPAIKGRAQAERVDRLRRRVDPNAETDQGPYLGPAWQNPDREGDRLRPYLDCRTGLPPAR